MRIIACKITRPAEPTNVSLLMSPPAKAEIPHIPTIKAKTKEIAFFVSFILETDYIFKKQIENLHLLITNIKTGCRL